MRLFVLLACAVFAVACSSSEPDVPALPEVPVSETTTFTARPDIVDAHPLVVSSWSKVDEDTVALHFETGTPECFGVDPVVVETDDTVSVAVRGGTLPEAQDRMCIMIAVAGTVEVPLSAPIGERVVTAET